jgi:hypothetical protein
MSRPIEPPAPTGVVYEGEVWTDTRGYAVVRLPADAPQLDAPLEYRLRDIEPPTTAEVVTELEDGRFTIRTDQPHVKVAWWVRGRRTAAVPAHPQQQEETT